MEKPAQASAGKRLPRLARSALGSLPRDTRLGLYRRMVDCDATPDSRLKLGIATTQHELEACFGLLHDAYVASGFMQPDPSGLRVTPYHALPTTTTLFASFGDRIVGTLSIIREGVFGFPLQAVFDLTSIRAQPGRIAEISALAIHPEFRNTGGSILFPLMKFMYEYCTRYFDTRHLVIAVNPKHIEMYEALLLFTRLQAQAVANYDFVNGAPAVGATLDLASAPEAFRLAYEGRRPQRNLHHYFTEVSLANITFPERPYFTTNDPVMSPALLDYFFNQRTEVFNRFDGRKRHLLQAIYPEAAYRSVLPAPAADADEPSALRRHRRLSLKCPGRLEAPHCGVPTAELEVVDVSRNGFLARASSSLPEQVRGVVHIVLGQGDIATEMAVAVRSIRTAGGPYYGFHIESPGATWLRCIAELETRNAPVGGREQANCSANPSEDDWSLHDALTV
ncbi:MAG: hypothetical protein ABIR94_17735 [Rubrivivax sp.]